MCYGRAMNDLVALEERIAHLTRVVEDLSDVVARQQQEIAVLNRRVGLLMEQETNRIADTQDGPPLADQRPPHW